MDFLASWRLVKESQFVFALSLFFSVALGSYVNFAATPMYVSQAQVFVSTPMAASDAGALLSGSSFSQQRVKSYAQIINSPVILDPVIQKLSLPMNAKDLAKNVSASVPADTVLLNISVQDSNPQRASDIANGVAEQFSQAVANIEGSMDLLSGNLVTVSIAKKAVPAESPSSPKKAVNLVLAIMVGLLLGFGLAQLKRMMNLKVTSVDDLVGIPLLAAVEFDYEAKEKPLISELGKYSARTESFRTLRTSIRYIAPSVPAKVIGVTSAVPNEGKTTTALNFALSLAQSDCKTVVIEADLRRAQFSKYKGDLDKSPGVASLLTQKKKLTMASVTKVAVQVKDMKLWILPCSKIPQNPAELLGSERFDELLQLLRKDFDYIIIDCPPILPVTDASIIASKVDGVILIVHTGKTLKSELVAARASVESVNGKLFGVVLNKIPPNSAGSYAYRYGYRTYFGRQYTSEQGLVYAPSEDEIKRMDREEFFDKLKK